MINNVFDTSKVCVSDCPKDFIPAGARTFTGTDVAEDGAETTVFGFFDPKTGQFHIQEYKRTKVKK